MSARVAIGAWGAAIGVALVVAWRTGGAADAASALPKSEGARARPSAIAAAEDAGAYQATARLIDLLNDARIDAPSARTAEPLFAAHARKTRAPLAGARGDAARFAATVALVADGGPVTPPPPPPAWNPQTHPWMAGEGTFDEREAIYAPTPSTFTFKVRVPLGAKLSFAPGTMNRTNEAVVFAVSAIDARGVAHDLFAKRVAPAQERRWLDDESVDLAAFAGETIDLRLRTSTAPPTHDELVAVAGSIPRAKPKAAPSAPSAASGAAAPAKPPPPAADRALAIPSPIALALWGTPTILARGDTSAPYDVLWIDVESLRPDAPALASIAARGVAFPHAYASATWSRPSVLAMLAGARSTELGVDATRFAIKDEADRFYGSAPPLVPLLLREQGVITRAFVGDPLLAPHLPIGIDLGFARVDARVARTKDAKAIADEAASWIAHHADERFFVYCAPGKDDGAIGALVGALDAAKLRDRTLLVVTADHVASAAGSWEETTHVPLVVAFPAALAIAPRAVDTRVRGIDLAPTVLDVEGIDATAARAKMSGRSLLPLARGESEPDERVVVSEGRGGRAVLAGTHRLVVRDPPAPPELFDLATDPTERHDLARDQPDVVAEMRARLEAALANVPAAGTAASVATAGGPIAVVHFRFAGAGAAHRVAGKIVARGGRLAIEGAGLGAESWKVDGPVADVAFATVPDGAVGFDVRVDPASAPVAWDLTLDDAPWPADRVYAGPYGLASPKIATGLASDEARNLASASALPFIDPARDLGVFVTRGAQ